jgi:type VI secretion system secreted protein Hcp
VPEYRRATNCNSQLKSARGHREEDCEMSATIRAYLKIDDVKGDSTEAEHKDWIVVRSFLFAEKQLIARSGRSSSGAAGPVDMQDVVITTETGSATPKLMEMCAAGTHIKQVLLEIELAEGISLRWELLDAVMSGFQIASVPDLSSPPSDQISLAFSQIKLTYTSPRAQGDMGVDVTGTWNLVQNRPA